jgi:hypothetical protein
MKSPCVPVGGFYVLYDEASEAAEEKNKEEELQQL